jgi:transposase-like protein
MNDDHADGSSPGRMLDFIREARFARGFVCPRCNSRRVQRWGHFSGRQRYRCKGCRRTFSDLTGTPAAYIKKLGLWDQYSLCLTASYSVRKSARLLRIDPTTAFRWRHRRLRPLQYKTPEQLHSWIELDTTRFAYSEKGNRKLRRPPRRRGTAFGELPFQPVVVLAACDRAGHAIASKCGSRLTGVHLRQTLAGNVAKGSIVCAASGPFSPAATFARHLRGAYYNTQPRACTAGAIQLLTHTRNAAEFCERLKAWIARFRGVATKYLDNYLAWHVVLDRTHRQTIGAETLRWPLAVKRGK